MFISSANFWYAVGRDFVQAPALFAGLLAGRGILSLKDTLLKDKDERYLDSKAREYASDEKLLETVKKYSPVRISEKREKTREGSRTLELPEESERLDASRIGNKAGEIASDTVNAVKQGLGGFFGTIKRKAKERSEEREQKDKERYEAIKRKYDKY
jgi:hypothetical protein